jgi:cytochrome c
MIYPVLRERRGSWREGSMIRRLVSVLLLLLFTAACGRGAEQPPVPEHATVAIPGGDATRGVEVLEAYACGACHVIPGVPDASSPLGPSLAGLASRRELAGGLPNTPENLMRWIQNPQEIDPGTGMPDMNVTDEDARHMAAYLYTLR